MTEENRELKIENLIYKLNISAQQRKECLDRLWVMECETEKLRLELLSLMDGKGKYGTPNLHGE